jgi:hypothetical protein
MDDNLVPVPDETPLDEDSPEVFQLKCDLSMLQDHCDFLTSELEKREALLERAKEHVEYTEIDTGCKDAAQWLLDYAALGRAGD